MMTATAANQATRLTELRRRSGLSLHQVAEKLTAYGADASRSHSAIQRYETNPAVQLRRAVLVGLAKIYRTTVNFIEHGESSAKELRPTYGLPEPATFEFLGTLLDLPYIELPFIAPAAYGTFATNCQDFNPEDFTLYRVLKIDGVDYRSAVVLEIRGNSMAPRYPERSRYVVRPVQDGNWQYAQGVHAISLRSEMFIIKRITQNKDGVLTLTSDNGGAEMNVTLGDILCMWKVGEAVYMPAED